MSELDLSKAYKAAASGIASDQGRVNTVDRDCVVGSMCVDLALPHILDALADEALAGVDREEWGSLANIGTAKWLRAKAEAARD